MLYWNTVTPLLRLALERLMAEPLFDPFRLIGGTSLSLQIGHRMSIDIDLFTDAKYGSIDFLKIDNYLRQTYNYVSPAALSDITGMGISYIIGSTSKEALKLDVYYTNDAFIFPVKKEEGIRLAPPEEIAAMKIDVVQRGGRKKDFWDIHALLDTFSLQQMIDFHLQRHPYNHEPDTIKANLINYASADQDPDPICLFGKHWEIIKLDITEEVEKLS